MRKPSVSLKQVPPAASGGSDVLDHIGGRVVDGGQGAQIVLYTHSKDTWYVQPFRSHPFTKIESDGSWSNVVHLGSDYAALLVAPGYRPSTTLPALPSVSGSVLAVEVVKGSSGHLPDPKVLHFSGYDWNVRSSADDRGGRLCDYEPSNAWVDDRGYLHLIVRQDGTNWHCAGLSLTRSLGYGTYRFVVSDSVQLPQSVVLAMYTRSDRQEVNERSGLAVELSRSGQERHGVADFVLQPYYIPGHTARFNVPPGQMTYAVRWDPGSAAFKAFAGDSAGGRGKVTEHVFQSGVPVPGTETVHFEFYDFHRSEGGLPHPAEIVVQKFDYLP